MSQLRNETMSIIKPSKNKNKAFKRTVKSKKVGKDARFKIFVGGFPVEFDENDLFEYMGTFGEVVEAKLHTKKNGQSKGFGFVSFEKKSAAKKALQIRYHTINNKKVSFKVKMT